MGRKGGRGGLTSPTAASEASEQAGHDILKLDADKVGEKEDTDLQREREKERPAHRAIHASALGGKSRMGVEGCTT